ncbi:uncharacterized protein conv [Dermacentor andersoni]|uniref:uncharacterized protein conv n=1 Tax=Dermacentor andersoni TaxID=34620 RepID=UPI003B3A640E
MAIFEDNISVIPKFRPYLYGRSFKVVSDHHALCWLANLKDPSGRLARWSLRLQEYDITVTYKSGRKHSDADCLSRAPIDPPPQDDEDDDAFLGIISAEDFAEQQRGDPELKGLVEYLEGHTDVVPRAFKRGLSSFTLQNNLLVKKNFSPVRASYLLVVPSALRPEILHALHDDPTAGHLGFSRTLSRIQERYYWPRLTADVARYVKTCRDCQRRKTPPTRPAGLLQPIEPPRRPFQQIGMDLLGPLPMSTSGNKWIVVATDYLTRFAETKALPKGSAAEVAKFFVENILLRHGAPEVLITDRGTAFTAELTQAILQYSQTSHRRTTAYHPQTNGLTERLNKTLADMLAMYVDVEHKTWDAVLPYVTFAYNTAVQETTQITPFKLVYGRNPTTTLDAMLPHVTDEENVDVASYLQRAEEARQLARLRIKNQQRTDSRHYNLRRRFVEYQPGDRVWVWTPIRRRGLSEKLLRRYFGPYKIIRRIGALDYEVVPDGISLSQRRRSRPEIVHVVRLKPVLFRAAPKMRALVVICFFVTASFAEARPKCPSGSTQIYPCKCARSEDVGLHIACDGVNLAMMSRGLGNVQHPIANLTITGSSFKRLFGDVFSGLQVINLTVAHGSLASVAIDVMDHFNESLKLLSFEDNALTEIPVELINKFRNLTSLNLAHNRIEVIPANAFGALNILFELRLDHNLIFKVHPSAFTGLNRLERLEMHHNKMEKIERNTFRFARKIKYLDLSYNNFTAFQKIDFNQLTNMWFLNISNNRVKTFPRGMFVANAILRVINMSYNELPEVDANTVKGVRFLRDVYFRGNRITKVHKQAFVSSKHIRTIDLAHNLMEDVGYEQFKDFQWLEKLDLSYNKISKIASSAFLKMYQVHIDLSHNNISFIGDMAFQELSNVTLFDLSHNNITTLPKNAFYLSDVTVLLLNHNNISDFNMVPVANITGIKVLNMTFNKINELNRKAFTKKRLYELHTVDFSYNNISEISGSVFEKLAGVRFINLSHNVIKKIGYSTFGSIPTLLELDISHNNISDVSHGGLSAMVSVRLIRVNDNKIKRMFNLPIALNELHLQNNQIAHFGPGTFRSMNSLLRLYLDSNNLTRLERGSFSNLLTLQTLSLSNNSIDRIPWEALQDLSSLQYLYLNDNKIKALPKKALGRLPVVFELRLQNNQINNVTEYAFEGMLQLIRLNLSYNNISFIPPEAFKGLVSLQTLDLSHNLLNKLENKTHGLLDDLLSLSSINVSHNEVAFVTEKTFPRSPYIPYKLKHVDLSHNFISVLTNSFDDGLGKAEYLDLRHNLINEVYPNVLRNLTSLKHLDMSHNDLRHIANGALVLPENVSWADFSHNKIFSIDLRDFLASQQLQHLDLRFNNVTMFEEEYMARIKNGLRLYYEGNPLNCDCRVKYLRQWLGHNPQATEWNDVVCHSPHHLHRRHLADVSPDVLECLTDEERAIKGEEDGSLVDLKFRLVDSPSKRAIRFAWYVATKEDVSGFRAIVSDVSTSSLMSETDIPYRYREYTIDGLESSVEYRLCLVALDSTGEARVLPMRQCRTVTPVGAATRTVKVVPVLIVLLAAVTTAMCSELWISST